MKRAFAFLVVLLLLAGLVAGLAWFQFVQKPEMIRGFIAAAPRPAMSVAVEEAREEVWEPRLPAIGTFRATQGVDVAPQIGGIVREIGFESGQNVKKGALLAQIDDSVEQADLKANAAALRNAELALDRQRQLVGGGATTKANLDAALSARDSAAAAVERTRALISQKRLTAPFDGRLGLRRVDVGQYLSPGAAIVSLQQLDPILIDFPLPERQLGAIKEGQPIEVTVDAYPGVVFKGRIASIDARVSAETRNVLVRSEIDNKELRLRPGMFGNVSVIAGEPRKVVTVPRTAVSFSLYGDAVFAVKPGKDGAADTGVVERRFVRSGDTRGDRVAIAEGVAPGDRLVIEGQTRLQPGANVKISAQGATSAPLADLPKE